MSIKVTVVQIVTLLLWQQHYTLLFWSIFKSIKDSFTSWVVNRKATWMAAWRLVLLFPIWCSRFSFKANQTQTHRLLNTAWMETEEGFGWAGRYWRRSGGCILSSPEKGQSSCCVLTAADGSRSQLSPGALQDRWTREWIPIELFPTN